MKQTPFGLIQQKLIWDDMGMFLMGPILQFHVHPISFLQICRDFVRSSRDTLIRFISYVNIYMYIYNKHMYIYICVYITYPPVPSTMPAKTQFVDVFGGLIGSSLIFTIQNCFKRTPHSPNVVYIILHIDIFIDSSCILIHFYTYIFIIYASTPVFLGFSSHPARI